MSSENYVFACDGKTFNLIRSKVNTPTGQLIIDFIYNSQQLQFKITIHNIFTFNIHNSQLQFTIWRKVNTPTGQQLWILYLPLTFISKNHEISQGPRAVQEDCPPREDLCEDAPRAEDWADWVPQDSRVGWKLMMCRKVKMEMLTQNLIWNAGDKLSCVETVAMTVEH